MLSSKKAKIRVPNRLGLSGQSFESLWGILKDAIDKIYKGQVSELSFEMLYRTVYTMVLRRKAGELYNNLERYLGSKLDDIEQWRVKDLKGFELLQEILAVWEAQCHYFKLISDIMIYLDKVYCKYERKMETYDLGLDLFKKHVLNPAREKVNEAMLLDINKARSEGSLEVTHSSTWKGIVGMMETLEDEKDNYFLNHFEPALLQETENYYSTSFNYRQLSPVEYLETMKNLKSFEFALNQKFVNADTTVKVTAVLENVLIWSQQFMEAVPILMRQAVTNNDTALLEELCLLSSEEKYCSNIVECIKDCIWEDANCIIVERNTRRKAQAATQWTTKVIELYNFYKAFLCSSGLHNIMSDGDNSSVNIINTVIGKYLNQDAIQSCEFITLYLDAYLKLSQEKREFNKVKQSLEQCVKVFKLIGEKDIFENYYKKLLSKRLLQQRSSIELEKWLVKQIKDEMGNFFTSKLDGMLRDISTSMELSKSFKIDETANGLLQTTCFTSQVLTMTSWPFQTATLLDENVVLSPQMQKIQMEYETFYNQKYNDRTLRWAHHLGYMEIGFQFESEYHDISMPIYGAVIFLLFQEHDQLTAEQIAELTNMPELELQRQLISLSMAPKSRILRKTPSTRIISPQDIFSINYSFSSPTQKVKLQTIANINSKESHISAGPDWLEKERMIEVNAAIVRILKSNKSLSHDALFKATAEALQERFTLPVSTYKKSIGNLLNKEYLQRDTDDSTIYHYIS